MKSGNVRRASYQPHPYSPEWVDEIASGRVSFRVSQRQFRQTGLWNEVYIRLRSKNQVMMGGPIEPNRFWCIAINRLGRDFGPRERTLGQFLQPRLTRLFQRHARREKAQWSACLLEQANTPFLFISSSGLVMLGRARQSSETARPVPRAALTPREGDILHWIVEGKTNVEIGMVLGISPRTVSKHCEHLFAKLGVENRIGAALFHRTTTG